MKFLKFKKSRNIIIFSFLVITSCQKEKYEPTVLDGYLENYVGKWNWDYTLFQYDECLQDINEIDTFNTTNTGDTYAIEFIKEGQINFFKNGINYRSHDIVEQETHNESIISFWFLLDNDENMPQLAILSNNSLLFTNFPFRREYCSYVSNQFIKE